MKTLLLALFLGWATCAAAEDRHPRIENIGGPKDLEFLYTGQDFYLASPTTDVLLHIPAVTKVTYDPEYNQIGGNASLIINDSMGIIISSDGAVHSYMLDADPNWSSWINLTHDGVPVVIFYKENRIHRIFSRSQKGEVFKGRFNGKIEPRVFMEFVSTTTIQDLLDDYRLLKIRPDAILGPLGSASGAVGEDDPHTMAYPLPQPARPTGPDPKANSEQKPLLLLTHDKSAPTPSPIAPLDDKKIIHLYEFPQGSLPDFTVVHYSSGQVNLEFDGGGQETQVVATLAYPWKGALGQHPVVKIQFSFENADPVVTLYAPGDRVLHRQNVAPLVQQFLKTQGCDWNLVATSTGTKPWDFSFE